MLPPAPCSIVTEPADLLRLDLDLGKVVPLTRAREWRQGTRRWRRVRALRISSSAFSSDREAQFYHGRRAWQQPRSHRRYRPGVGDHPRRGQARRRPGRAPRAAFRPGGAPGRRAARQSDPRRFSRARSRSRAQPVDRDAGRDRRADPALRGRARIDRESDDERSGCRPSWWRCSGSLRRSPWGGASRLGSCRSTRSTSTCSSEPRCARPASASPPASSRTSAARRATKLASSSARP